MDKPNIPPCKGCEKRHLKCHGECQEYIIFRKKQDEILAERKRLNDAKYDFADMKTGRIVKAIKDRDRIKRGY